MSSAHGILAVAALVSFFLNCENLSELHQLPQRILPTRDPSGDLHDLLPRKSDLAGHCHDLGGKLALFLKICNRQSSIFLILSPDISLARPNLQGVHFLLTSGEGQPVFTFVFIFEAELLSECQPFLKLNLPHGFGLPAINYAQEKLLNMACKRANTSNVE